MVPSKVLPSPQESSPKLKCLGSWKAAPVQCGHQPSRRAAHRNRELLDGGLGRSLLDRPRDGPRGQLAKPCFQGCCHPFCGIRGQRPVHQGSNVGCAVLVREKDAIYAELAQVVELEFSRDVGVCDNRESRILPSKRLDFRVCVGSVGVIRVNDTSIDGLPCQRLIQRPPRRAHDQVVASPEGGAHSRRCSNIWLEDC